MGEVILLGLWGRDVELSMGGHEAKPVWFVLLRCSYQSERRLGLAWLDRTAESRS